METNEKAGADELGSAAADEFRFSPRPNRAAEIQWRPWGDEAFAEARRERKPVLLAISAVWCHWCHVMDETSYSTSAVISAVNERFVPVRVDNDRRPDINRRYNMGGWPTTAFLTETGDVITGATYLPPKAMQQALERVERYYAEHRDELAVLSEPDETSSDEGGDFEQAGPAADTLAAGSIEALDLEQVAEPEESLSHEPIDWVLREVLEAFDPIYGGFGGTQKFPQVDALELLLLRAADCRDERVDEVLTESLRRMARSALYDRVEDGFFRYSTMRDWSEPHYEKMLQDNAGLLRLYANAFAVLGDAAHANTARGIARYLLRVLWQEGLRAFAGSQDADEAYYQLGEAERHLLAAPFIDRTVFTDWNAAAARGLLRASQVLAQPELAAPALAVLDTLWDAGHTRRGMAHYLTADASGALAGGPVAGLLGDQAEMAAALLDAYEHSGQRVYLARAAVIGDWVDERLTAADGSLLDQLSSAGSPGLLARPLPALPRSSLMADGFMRLALYTGEAHYRERGARVLAALHSQYRQHSIMAAGYASALIRYLEPQVHVVVVGDPEAADTHALLRAGLCLPGPLRTAQLLDPVADLEHIVRDGYLSEALPVAYVCLNSVCLPPTATPGEITRLARGGTPENIEEG